MSAVADQLLIVTTQIALPRGHEKTVKAVAMAAVRRYRRKRRPPDHVIAHARLAGLGSARSGAGTRSLCGLQIIGRLRYGREGLLIKHGNCLFREFR
jgi:hypothetical protein